MSSAFAATVFVFFLNNPRVKAICLFVLIRSLMSFDFGLIIQFVQLYSSKSGSSPIMRFFVRVGSFRYSHSDPSNVAVRFFTSFKNVFRP